jgi:DNA-binding transcriptional regulator YbjK
MSRNATAQRRRRSKGEQTREVILEGALRVIAREGLRGVTHRAVAAEANVQLSLTTYYFKDIAALIEQAFELFCDRSQLNNEEVWSSVFNYLEAFGAADLRKTATRERICDELAGMAAGILVENVLRRPDGLAVEQVFFSSVLQASSLRERAQSYRQSLLTPLIQICRRFNRVDPELDAELLLDTMTRLEYESLLVAPGAVDRNRIERLLRRQIGWALGLKRA